MLSFLTISACIVSGAFAAVLSRDNRQDTFPPFVYLKNVTYHADHSRVSLAPSTRCPTYEIRGRCKVERSSVWERYTYWDSAAERFLSSVVATNILNGKTPRNTISIKSPRAQGIQVYGAAKSRLWGHEVASQEICFGQHACFDLDAQRKYAEWPTSDESVLLWDGPLYDMAPGHKVEIIMTEGSQVGAEESQAKYMTLDRVVFIGVDRDEQKESGIELTALFIFVYMIGVPVALVALLALLSARTKQRDEMKKLVGGGIDNQYGACTGPPSTSPSPPPSYNSRSG